MSSAITIAITGGIAMGKSTFGKILSGHLAGATFFDADKTVQELLTTPEIVARIAQEFGDSVLSSEGQLDRPRLREQVFDNAHQRATLENILHPVVRKKFEDQRERSASAAEAARRVFVADIPLLFESDYRFERDLTLTLATTPATQIKRLVDSRGLSENLARNIIAAQMPIVRKMALSDVVFWNEGCLGRLEQQVSDFIQWLRTTKKIPK